MKIMLITLLSAVLLMTGCAASGPVFTPAEKLDPNQSFVYIYRPDSLIGCGVTPHIYIDEVKKGPLKNNGYLVCSAEPGKRMIEATSLGVKPLVIYLDIVAGSEYFVRWWFDSDGMTYSYHMGLIPSEYALREIRGAKKSE